MYIYIRTLGTVNRLPPRLHAVLNCCLVCRWDPESNRWSFVCPMSVARLGAGVTACSGVLYVVGGYDGQNRWNTAEKYQPDSNTWQQLAPMSTIRSGLGECVCVCVYTPVFMRASLTEQINDVLISWL